ncbi:hypothetical protein [Acinetobacter ursingii]|uniref:hypothetical protein n=1 Tax=Acinetobacter ursingii TaxID=108980 RepID=UPI0021E3369F|nr:hypothetical protein [Acinetobacter ursingii]UYF80102.1 hypothetical protein LSO59_06125 [Acinetobacter ursingii]
MSNYRDDTQETIVLSSAAFGKVTSGDVENFKFTETILNKIRHNVEEIIKLADADLSIRRVDSINEFGFSDQVFHGVRKFQLIEEFFSLGEQTFVKHKDLINENLGLGETQTVNYSVFHIEPFKLNDVSMSYKTAFHSISDQFKLRDGIASLTRSIDLVEESLVFTDSTRDKLKTLIVETMNLGQQLEQHATTNTLIADTFKFKAQAIHVQRDLINEYISLKDEFKKLSDTVELVIETMAFTDHVSGQRTVKSLAESSLGFSASVEGLKKATSSVTELFFLDDAYQDGREIIGAWTTTADGWNMSRYYDYPYEQLIVIGDQIYGVTANGIEELKPGARTIAAQIKTAKLDLGDGGLVHPESMILEYSLDGNLSVDVVTTQSGYLQKFNYVLQKEPSEYLTNGRVVFGRGLRGRHFEFAVNIEGSTAYINDMVVNITKTKRRI